MKKALTTLAVSAVSALGLAGILATSASASMIIGDPGVYLSSTPSLTLAAPNTAFTKDISGKAAVLKTCLGDGNCASTDNLKTTEDFDLVQAVAPATWTGTELRLHGTQWCITNRGTAVTFETCHAYASQRWTSSGATLTGVLTNVKTGGNLTHTGLAAYQPVQTGGSQTHWGNSS